MWHFQAVLSYVKDGGFSAHYQSLHNKAFRNTIHMVLGLGTNFPNSSLCLTFCLAHARLQDLELALQVIEEEFQPLQDQSPEEFYFLDAMLRDYVRGYWV